jgi:hypothetical protein
VFSSPLDILIIAYPKAEVKHFGKNKKIIIFAKTLDKNAARWYNRKFRRSRPPLGGQIIIPYLFGFVNR